MSIVYEIQSLRGNQQKKHGQWVYATVGNYIHKHEIVPMKKNVFLKMG